MSGEEVCREKGLFLAGAFLAIGMEENEFHKSEKKKATDAQLRKAVLDWSGCILEGGRLIWGKILQTFEILSAIESLSRKTTVFEQDKYMNRLEF